LLAALLGAAIGWACINEPFHCENDQQCVANGVTGQCQGNQYCTFPDEDCASGQRYAESAGGGLAGTCLPPGEAMGTDGGDDTTGGGGGSGGSDGSNDSTAGVDDATGAGTSRGGTTEDDGHTDTTDDDIGDDDDDDDDDDDGPFDYPPCINFDECKDPSHLCLEPDLEEVCAPPCRSFKDCPIPPNSPTVPICTDANSTFPGVCIFPCSTNFDCPDPLDCVEDDIGLYSGEEVCAWD